MNPGAADRSSWRHRDSGASLKPENLKPENHGLASDLVGFEGSVDAERLARLAADSELVQTLQWLSFNPDTEEWAKLQNALIAYGWSVFTGWFMTGVALQRAKRRGVHGFAKLPATLKLNRERAQDLAVDLMITSVETFRANVLCRNKWDSTRGATLKTYFVGHCLFQLPDVYVRWRRDAEPLQPCLEAERDLKQRGIRADAGRLATDVVHVEAALGSLNPETRAMFELQAAGYSYAEIADLLEVSESIVGTNLSRAREAARLGKSA